MLQDFDIRKTSHLTLDVSHVQRADAVGLAIFISNMLHAFGDRHGHEEQLNPKFSILYPLHSRTRQQMKNLRVTEILACNGLIDFQYDLWSTQEYGSDDTIAGTANCLIHVSNTGPDGRDDQLRVAKSQLKAFFKSNAGRSLNQSQMLLILTEMIKNTLDHTDHHALLGISIRFRADDRPEYLEFCYCEQGVGLSKTLREKIRHATEVPSRGKKGSLADLLHWALKPGSSTKKGNGINYGIGMTIITQCARSLGIDLCMFDAQSMVALGHLPAEPAHTTVRSAISPVARQGCFTYTGSKYYD